MEGRLITDGNNNYSLLDYNNELVATNMSSGITNQKLSIKNCETIVNGYDLDELVKSKYPNVDNEDFEYDCEHDMIRDNYRSRGFYEGAKAIIEILGDKKFSEHQLKEAVAESWNSCEDNEGNETFTQVFKRIIQSLQQTEWDVDIVTEPMNLDEIREQGKGFLNSNTNKPKLDADGCLILKRK